MMSKFEVTGVELALAYDYMSRMLNHYGANEEAKTGRRPYEACLAPMEALLDKVGYAGRGKLGVSDQDAQHVFIEGDPDQRYLREALACVIAAPGPLTSCEAHPQAPFVLRTQALLRALGHQDGVGLTLGVTQEVRKDLHPFGKSQAPKI